MTLALFAALAGAYWLFEGRAALQLTGRAAVTDGDSLTIDGRRIRLQGLDAPELRQSCRRNGQDYACGRLAAGHLRDLIAGRPVDCDSRRLDRYGRHLARCRVGGDDIGGRMVRDGWAIAYGDYDEAEAGARSGARGIWAGEFDPPARWRAQRGMAADDGGILAFILDHIRALRGEERQD